MAGWRVRERHQGIIASLDGWTVEIGPITVPAISIRLTKPKEQK